MLHRIGLFLSLFLALSPLVFAQGPFEGGDTLLWDGLETKGQWSINTKGEIGVSSDYKTEGQKSLMINVQADAPSHGIILKKSNTDLNVTFAKKVILDIYNSGPPCDLSLAFYTDGVRESLPKRIESGMNNNVVFEIAKDFRVPFGQDNVAQSVMFIVYPAGESAGPIYFDNIRVNTYRGLQYEPPGISPAFFAGPAEELPAPEEVVDTGPYSILNGSIPNNNPPPPIPEHKTFILFGAGLVSLAFYGKKNLKK